MKTKVDSIADYVDTVKTLNTKNSIPKSKKSLTKEEQRIQRSIDRKAKWQQPKAKF